MLSIPMVLELAGDVIKDGVIALTDHGTMRVPRGSGLGVLELDPGQISPLPPRPMPATATKAFTPRTRAAKASFP